MSTLKRVLALSLALVMVLSLNVFAADFSDKDEFDAVTAEAIDMLVELNILAGFTDGSFQPNETITRAQAAKMIYVLCNKGVDDGAAKYVGGNTFHDVQPGSWYEGYVEFCYTTGVIIGRGNDSVSGKPVFDPNAAVTGYELAKMLLVVGNYNPAVEGFNDSANWKNNVLRFANNTGLIDDYSVLMSLPAPRQWAALMFSNLILEVSWATYLGDSLVTGSTMGGVEWTVGQQLLGLIQVTGTVLSTPTLTWNDGTQELKVSSMEVDGVGTRTIGYAIPNKYVGQHIKMLVRFANNGLSGTALYSAANMSVYGMYLSGKSVTTETTVKGLAVTASKSTATLAYNNRLAVTVNGTKTTYVPHVEDDGLGVYWLEMTASNGYDFEDDFWSLLRGNDYDTIGMPAMPAVTGGAGDAALIAAWMADVVAVFANRDEKVLIVEDNNEDWSAAGTYDFIQMFKTDYSRVSNINASRISTSTTGSIAIEEANFTNGTPARNDVVAITENYITGECVYDIEIVAPTTVTASAWTTSGGAIDTVKLDGTFYKKAQFAASTSLNQNHQIYYIHNGFVVYSSDSLSSTGGAAPKDLVAITKVGMAVTGSWAVTMEVEYMLPDGTKKVAKYDYLDEDALFTATVADLDDMIADATLPLVTNRAEAVDYYVGTGLKDYLATTIAGVNPIAASTQLVQLEETDNGVFFVEIDSTTYAELTVGVPDTYHVDGTVRYSNETNVLRFTDVSNSVGGAAINIGVLSENASVYVAHSEAAATATAAYKAPTYAVVKVTELNSILDAAGEYLCTVVMEGTTVVAIYINLGTKGLPTEYNYTYAVVTGSAYKMGTGTGSVYVQLTLTDGTTVEAKLANGNLADITEATINNYTNRLVRYTVSGSTYKLYDLDLDDGVSFNTGTMPYIDFNEEVTEITATGFNTTNGRFLTNDKTLFVSINGSKVTILENEPAFGGTDSTVIVSKENTTGLIPTAVLVFVNTNLASGKQVLIENIQPKVTVTPPAPPVVVPVSIAGLFIPDLTSAVDETDITGTSINLVVDDVDFIAESDALTDWSQLELSWSINGGAAITTTTTTGTLTYAEAAAEFAALAAGDTIVCTITVAAGVTEFTGTAIVTFTIEDTTAPTITTVVATSGSANIVVTFSEDIQLVDNALPASFVVTGSALGAETVVSYSITDTDEITIVMSAALTIASTETVIVTYDEQTGDEIADLFDNLLADTATATYTAP